MKIRPWFLLAAMTAAGCGGYDAPSEVTLGSLVYTQPAPGASFTALRTYYLDPNLEVWEDGTAQPSQIVPSSTLTTINARMASYGYTAVTTPPASGSPPASDIGMRLAFLKSNYTYYVSDGYCSLYWVYWACWPGWAYTSSYSTGTVLMLMVDTRKTPPASSVLWATSLYAVLQGSSLENTTALNGALNRAFDQSTYLRTSAGP